MTGHLFWGQNTGPEGRGRGRSPRCLGGRVGPENQLRAVDMELKRTDEVLRERGRSMRKRKEQRVLQSPGWAPKSTWGPWKTLRTMAFLLQI